MYLSKESFKSIFQHTSLVSTDWIVRNEQWKALVVKHVNSLDNGYWFVLGRCVRKNITLDHAFDDSTSMYNVILSYMLRLKESQVYDSPVLQHKEEYKFFNFKKILLNYKFNIYMQNYIKLLS